MNNETKIIEELRNLRKKSNMPDEKKFLQNLKIKLSDHIYTHPAISGNTGTPWYLKFSFTSAANAIIIPHTLIMPQKTLAIIFIFCFLAMSTIAAASQNSLPGETLYPIKILTEDVRTSLAVTPESKAIIQSDFAAKRVEEIKQIIEKNGLESKNINIALDHLQKNTAKAADIIDKEKQNGNDVSALEKDIEGKNSANQNKLNQMLKKPGIEINNPSGKNENEGEKNDAEKSISEKGENNVKKNNLKKGIAKPDSDLQSEKPKAEENKNAAITSPEIKTTTQAKKRDSDSDDQNGKDND